MTTYTKVLYIFIYLVLVLLHYLYLTACKFLIQIVNTQLNKVRNYDPL